MVASNASFRIVSMVIFKERIFVASPDSVYEIINGKPVLVANPEDFRRADKEYEERKNK